METTLDVALWSHTSRLRKSKGKSGPRDLHLVAWHRLKACHSLRAPKALHL